MILGHFLIAGLPYQQIPQNLWQHIGTNTSVLAERERFNPHDPLAVSIRTADGVRLGYLRRDDNRIPSALLDQGATLQARIVEIDFAHEAHPRELRVELALIMDKPDS